MIENKIKSFANDTLTYGLFNMLGRLFTFLLTPLYSNYLSPAENGVLAYMFSLLVFAQFVYALGMEASFFRFFNNNESNKIYDNDIYNSKVFSSAYFTILTFGFISTTLLIIFSVPLSDVIIGADFRNSVYIFQIVALTPFIDELITIPLGKLRMQHKVKKFAIIRFLVVLLSVMLSVFFLLTTDLGVLGVFLAQLIASTSCLVYFAPSIIKSLDLNIDFKLFKEMFLFGLPTLPSNLSAIALQVADRPIMKMFVSNSDIGVYQINAKLAVPMLMFVTIFDYAWKPFFLSHFKDEDAKPLFSRILTYYIFIGSILFLFITFFMNYIVRIPIWNGKTLIHSDYWSGLSIVGIIVLGYLVNGITTNFAAVFHIEKKTKYLPIAIGMSAIISIALNFLLIPIIGTIGAAISLLIGYTSGMVIMKILQSKISYKIKYEWKRIFLIIISSAIIFLLGNYFASLFDLTISFFIKIGLMILYILLLKIFGFFTKGEIMKIKKVFRYIKI